MSCEQVTMVVQRAPATLFGPVMPVSIAGAASSRESIRHAAASPVRLLAGKIQFSCIGNLISLEFVVNQGFPLEI